MPSAEAERMNVLGMHFARYRLTEENRFHWGAHDTAAALVNSRDGLVAAAEEERFSRVKHCNYFPDSAIRFCLERAALSVRDLDYIALPLSETGAEQDAMRHFWMDSSIHERTARDSFGALFERGLGADIREKIRFSEHHEAHAWSAFAVSGYDNALVLVLDGDGEGDRAGLIGIGTPDGIEILRRFTASAHSLGLFYMQLINFVGYHRFDEYKVMGLAPYGDPQRYADLLSRLYDLLPNGDYVLRFFDEPVLASLAGQDDLISSVRRKGEPFSQTHKDFAAAMQAATERVILHVLEHYRRQTGMRNLCLAGGVGHNCSANGKVYYAGLFDSVYFQPVAHDAGLSFGAALHVMNKESPRPVRVSVPHLYLGTAIPDDPSPALQRWAGFLDIRKIDNVEATAARLLAEGQVLAWVQGRAEFGPRALGNRSIVADPRPGANKDRINQMVKKREGYRPFAPSILAERLTDICELASTEDRTLPFMISTLRVRHEWRERLQAITHVDGTARVQTVAQQTNPSYWRLIKEFEALSGVPVLLNTSLNNNIEPIVDTLDDAVSCFLTTGLHALVAGRYLVNKRSEDERRAALRACHLRLPGNRALVLKDDKCLVDCLSHPWLGQSPVEISQDMFALLRRSLQEPAAVAELLAELPNQTALIEELEQLWELRAVIVVPPA
jgi:carbamoyltransferase